MAGTQRGFDADKFRTAIRFVFTMAAPPEVEQQLIFGFAEDVSFTGPADGDAVPFDPSAPITRTVRTPLSRPCDVQFDRATDEITAFGVVIPAKITVTLLDEDYNDVQDATWVLVNGNRYLRHYEKPSYGLFDVGLHEMVFLAEDER